MANSFPASGLAYADQFSVGTSTAAASSLYVVSSCTQAVRIEHGYNQTNLHHNTLWLRATNSGANLAASIGFTVVNGGGDHHRANIAATGNANQIGGNLALYTRNNNGNDNLGIYIDHSGNTGINTTSPGAKLDVCGADGRIQSRVDSSDGSTINVRPNAGKCGWISYTEDAVADRWGIGIKNGDAKLYFSSGNVGSGGGTTRMVLDGSGNLGIGNTAPSAPLHVCAGGGDQSPILRLGGSAANSFNWASATIYPNVTSGQSIIHLVGKAQSQYNSGYVGFRQVADNCSTNMVTLGMYAADNLVNILGTGNVGIGTTTPGYSLDVVGGMKGNFYMSCCNATLDGLGPYDFGAIGTGNIAGALLINDIVGARYSVHAGSYNLTFRKSVRGTLTACAYCTVMTFLGTTDVNCVVNVNIANSLGLGMSPSYKLDITGTDGYTASMRIAAAYNGGGLGLVHLTSTGIEGGTITYEKTSGTAQKYKMGLAGTNCFFIYNETAGNQPFTLTPCGNIGISTTAPSKLLTVRHGDSDGIRVEYSGNTDNLLIDASTIQAYSGSTCSNLKLNASGGNVGINTNTPSYRLHVNGTFYAAGSSIKYKEGICNYDTNSCLFMCLKPVTYQYKDEFKHLGKELKADTQIGLIAEDVAEVMPELAVLVNEEDEKVVRNVDYEKLSIVLLAEVQKLRKEMDELRQSC